MRSIGCLMRRRLHPGDASKERTNGTSKQYCFRYRLDLCTAWYGLHGTGRVKHWKVTSVSVVCAVCWLLQQMLCREATVLKLAHVQHLRGKLQLVVQPLVSY